MKKIFALMAALFLICGFSVVSWAEVGDIRITWTPYSPTLSWEQDVTVDITIEPSIDLSGVDTVVYGLSHSPSVGSLIKTGDNLYRLEFNTKDILNANNTITFSSVVDITYSSGPPASYGKSLSVTFPIVAAPPTLTGTDIAIFCPTHNDTYNPTGSGSSFAYTLNGECIAKGHTLEVKVDIPGFTTVISPNATISAGSWQSGVKEITLKNDFGDTSSPVTLTINKSTSSNTGIGAVTLSGGATASTSDSSTNSDQRTIIVVPSTASGTINISATASADGAFTSLSTTSFNASAIPFDFDVTVYAPNGTIARMYYYRVIRATSTVTLLTNVNFTYAGSSLGTPLTNVPSNALEQTMSISTDRTSITLNVTPDPSCTITRVKWSNTTNWTDISSGNVTKVITLTPPTPGNSRELQIEVKAPDDTLYIVNINITNNYNSVDLATGVNIRIGSSSTSASAASTSAMITSGSTRTMTLSDTYKDYTTFYAHITLASGVTLSSATFGGNSASITNGNIVTLQLPTTTTSRDLVLNFSIGGNSYSATITVARASTTIDLVSGINIRTGAASTSTSVVSSNTTITSASDPQTMSIPTSYNGTSTFYAHITMYSGITLNSATFGGESASISNGSSSNVKVVTLSMSSSTSRNLVLNFSNGYSATITVTRGGTAVTLLTNVNFTYNGASLGVPLTNVQSNTLEQTMAISADAIDYVTLSLTPGNNCAITRIKWSDTANWTAIQNGYVAKTISLIPPVAGNSRELDIEVEAPGGQLYVVKTNIINNAGAGMVTLATGINIRTGSSATSPLVFNSTIPITSVGSTQTILIPAAYNTTTTFYVHIALANGVDLSSVTYEDGAIITAGNIFSLPLPTSATSRDFVLNFNVGGTNYAKTITVARASDAVPLATAVNIRTSTSASSILIVGSTTIITSTSASQTMTIPGSANNASVLYAHITLASDITLNSATFGSDNAFITNGNIVTLQLPTSTTSRDLVLSFNAGGVNYTKIITILCGGADSTLANIYFKRHASGANSSDSFTTSPGSFSPETRTYTVYVDENTEYIYIYPIKNNSSDSVAASGTYNNITTSGGYFSVRLNSTGINTVYLTVNGATGSNRYTLNIERVQTVVRNASLDSLVVNDNSTSSTSGAQYTLSPTFAYDKIKYDVSIPSTVSEVYLHFSAYQSDAIVTVTNATRISDGVYRATLYANMTKVVTFRVSYSGNTTTYTVNLNSGNSGNTGARLANLRVAAQESTSSTYQFALYPPFSSSVKNYVALVTNDKINGDTVYVQAILENTSDVLIISGSSVSSGYWKDIIIDTGSRNNRSTSVPIRVRESISVATDYNLTILAAPSSANYVATLDALSLRTGASTSTTLPSYNPFIGGIHNYTAYVVENEVEVVRVYFTAHDSNAWVLVNDVLVEEGYATVDLTEGSNIIKVRVYAEDCKTYKIYDILVNRRTKHNYTVFLESVQTTLAASDTLYVNVMLAGNLNYTQMNASIAYENNLLEFVGFENSDGLKTEVKKDGVNKISVRNVPSINMFTGAPCTPPVRVATLKFKLKENLSDESAAMANSSLPTVTISHSGVNDSILPPVRDTELTFASINVFPVATIPGATTAPGEALSVMFPYFDEDVVEYDEIFLLHAKIQ